MDKKENNEYLLTQFLSKCYGYTLRDDDINTIIKYYDIGIEQSHQEKTNLIKYLEDKIEEIKMTYSQINGDYGYMNDKLEVYQEILDKAKEGKYE